MESCLLPTCYGIVSCPLIRLFYSKDRKPLKKEDQNQKIALRYANQCDCITEAVKDDFISHFISLMPYLHRGH